MRDLLSLIVAMVLVVAVIWGGLEGIAWLF